MGIILWLRRGARRRPSSRAVEWGNPLAQAGGWDGRVGGDGEDGRVGGDGEDGRRWAAVGGTGGWAAKPSCPSHLESSGVVWSHLGLLGLQATPQSAGVI